MKPSLPQGTRDFKSDVLRKRYYIINTIKKIFEIYGFGPLETPALENLETLTGKYGDEGDNLIFKILNNGLDNQAKRDNSIAAFENVLSGKNDKNITSRALRYDLTIPFARFVAMNYNQLPMPFKRYQIQPVWRADRPQRGRYREFYQCDADVAGTYSLSADAEFALLYQNVFRNLKIPVTIKLNNRKLLVGLSETAGTGLNAMRVITVAIDKLDKIGLEEVKNELKAADLNDGAIAHIEKYLSLAGNTKEKLEALKTLLKDSETGMEGLKELEYVFHKIGDSDSFQLDTTLARGLDYYTGTIYEIKARGVSMGSIGGGGRYNDLTGLFGVKDVPGVGISFGIDRIYDVMDELGIFPEELEESSAALFFNLGDKEADFSFELMTRCRSEDIPCEIFYEPAKLDKQFKYANKRKIPYIIIIGSVEMQKNQCTVKELSSGREDVIPANELAGFLKKRTTFKNFSQ